MSVVSRGIFLFCEGKQTSLDYRLLSKITEEIAADRCTIVSAGGKFGFSVFAQGYFFPEELTNQKYIVFRDRDFDVQPTPNSQLLHLGNRRRSRRVITTYRSCIENYLLDPILIHQYWREKFQEKLETASKWGHGDSPGIEAIADWIETSAKNLQFYQAVRWALGDLLRTSAAREHLKTTWTGGSGKLPESLTLQDCQQEGVKLVEEFRKAALSITPENFLDRLSHYQEYFSQDEFWAENRYLIWFHGKDLQKEMQRQQSNYISLSSFFEWAIARLDMTQHPDLMDLKARIEDLLED
ncbi:DUF4435 domain-containing protein [Baaleninema simplex]|uniref:DUF4435 domain-containing protein n=1 Tax=Baaleninema simplex TaxID=2862350 RepID=UPI0004756481|nr:DUF4435 domain-containing protein [Baaleninema simplex]